MTSLTLFAFRQGVLRVLKIMKKEYEVFVEHESEDAAHYQVMWITLSIPAVVLNVMSLVLLFVTAKRLSVIQKYYLVSFGLADLVCGACMLHLGIIRKRADLQSCYFNQWGFLFSSYMDMYLLLFFSGQRCFIIRFPFKSVSVERIQVVRAMICLAFVVAVTATVLSLVRYGCSDWSQILISNDTRIVIAFLYFPLVMVIFTDSYMIYVVFSKARKARAHIMTTGHSKVNLLQALSIVKTYSRQIRVASTTLLIFGSFLFVSLPTILFQAYLTFKQQDEIYDHDESAKYLHWKLSISEVTLGVSGVRAIINPFILCFRQTPVKLLIYQYWPCCRQAPRDSERASTDVHGRLRRRVFNSVATATAGPSGLTTDRRWSVTSDYTTAVSSPREGQSAVSDLTRASATTLTSCMTPTGVGEPLAGETGEGGQGVGQRRPVARSLRGAMLQLRESQQGTGGELREPQEEEGVEEGGSPSRTLPVSTREPSLADQLDQRFRKDSPFVFSKTSSRGKIPMGARRREKGGLHASKKMSSSVDAAPKLPPTVEEESLAMIFSKSGLADPSRRQAPKPVSSSCQRTPSDAFFYRERTVEQHGSTGLFDALMLTPERGSSLQRLESIPGADETAMVASASQTGVSATKSSSKTGVSSATEIESSGNIKRAVEGPAVSSPSHSVEDKVSSLEIGAPKVLREFPKSGASHVEVDQVIFKENAKSGTGTSAESMVANEGLASDNREAKPVDFLLRIRETGSSIDTAVNEN